MTRRTGFTLVELLIAMAVVGIILGVIGTFFASNARVTRQQQLRTDLELTARTIGDMIVQDFQLVGSRAAAATDGSGVAANAVAAVELATAVDYPAVRGCFAFDDDTSDCLSITFEDPDVEGPEVIRWDLYYLSSLWLTESLVSGEEGNFNEQLKRACRHVEYLISDGRVLRSDVQCLDALDDLAGADDAFPFEVAAGVDLVSLSFKCAGSDMVLYAPESSLDACFKGDDPSFVRAVDVIVELTSLKDPSVGIRYEIATATPNLQPPTSLLDGTVIE